jgi:hypothetical protein
MFELACPPSRTLTEPTTSNFTWLDQTLTNIKKLTLIIDINFSGD